jgi:3-oxoacyl-[acyl-carrier-protein] synthase-3
MTGRLVKETATRELPVAIRKIIGELGFTLQDIDALFPHQPSKVVLDELEESLDLLPGVLKRNIEHRGNTAGATVPLLLDEYLKTSKLKPGALVAFAAIGSGWTWGAAVTKWIKA